MNWTAKQISGLRIRIERSHIHIVSYRVRCENPVSEMFYPGSTKVIEFDVPYVGVYTIAQIPLIDNDLPIKEQTVNVTNPVTPTELEQLEEMWTQEIETTEMSGGDEGSGSSTANTDSPPQPETPTPPDTLTPTPKKTRVPRKRKP